MNWTGVMPAMTTPFTAEMKVDHAYLAQHAAWQLGNGCVGLIMLGSLAEGATLEHDEKIAILKTAVRVAGKLPVVASISALSTQNAVTFAKQAEDLGCSGLMVLPPYVYTSDWYEMKQHIVAILRSTKLECMLYNNPIAYKTDFLPDQIAELASEHENLKAVKESSTDVRRVAAIRSVLGDTLSIFVGVDDVIVEALGVGAVGWVAGLVNAYPAESVKLVELVKAGKHEEAFALYRWFLPLLRLDTVPKFVQLIKWVQEQAGVGSARVRAPRLELRGEDLVQAKAVFDKAKATRAPIDERPISEFAGA
jgi:dihydrodipicolinate synthase/N-acetylneuraminate lyase